MTGLESWIDDSARKYSFALVHNWFIQNWRGQFFLILDEIKLFMTFTRYRSKSDDYIVIILRSIPLAECGSDMKLCKY